MKNFTKLLALALVILGFSANSFGQGSATASSDASAKILSPISISNTVPLNFGTIGPIAAVSTVTVATNNNRTGTAFLLSVAPAAVAGQFLISGTPNAAFSITLPSATTELKLTGQTSMTINSSDWVSDLGLASTIAGNGSRTLSIGATLNIGNMQAAGTYTGSYEVTVAYN